MWLYTLLCLSVVPLVRQSVRPSVGWSITLYLFGFLHSLASLFLPKWSSNLKNRSCPPALGWGSRVSACMIDWYICLSVSLSVHVFIFSAAGRLVWLNALIIQFFLFFSFFFFVFLYHPSYSIPRFSVSLILPDTRLPYLLKVFAGAVLDKFYQAFW